MNLEGTLRILCAAVLALSAVRGAAASAQPLQGFGSSDAKLPPALAVSAFYDPPDLGRHRPGDLLRYEPIAGPAGSKAWRILYVSKGLRGEPAAVSGVAIVPDNRLPAPRRILTWAHGTTGAARGCAPSLSANPDQRFLERGGIGGPIDSGIPYLDDFLSRNDVIVATDYAGLGAPGGHPYLIGDIEAENVLDAARAAAFLPGANVAREVSVLGWSQGGQAAIFAGEIARAYAPELHISGIATLAPAATVMHPQIDALFRSDTPHVYEIIRAYAAAYALETSFLTARGRGLVDAAGEGCILSVFDRAKASSGPGVIGDISQTAGWVAAFTKNQAGDHPSAAPILVVQGTADNIVAPAGTELYRKRACSIGSALQVEWIPGGDHRSIRLAAQQTVLAWLDARAAKTPMTSSCP